MNRIVIRDTLKLTRMNWRSVFFWSALLFVVWVSGVVYGWLFHGETYIGGVYALFVCIPIITFERGLFLSRFRRWLRTLPTLTYLVGGLIFYSLSIYTGFIAAGSFLWSTGLISGAYEFAAIPSPSGMIYTLAVSLIVVAVLRVRDLLGRNVFLNLLVGRYRKPIREDRIFLFIDLVGSTGFAEKFGDLSMMELLSEIFATIAEPVRHHRGAIDDYIGDLAIISWPMKDGVVDARCVRCALDIFELIERDPNQWATRFGEAPKVRAALHGGPIVTADVGVDHHKIAYFGDTMNTTARIEGLCRSLKASILISGSLLDQMKLPANVLATEMGAHSLRGKGAPVVVFSLDVKREAP